MLVDSSSLPVYRSARAVARARQVHKETIATGTAPLRRWIYLRSAHAETVPVVDSVELGRMASSAGTRRGRHVFAIAAATRASKGATLTDFRALQPPERCGDDDGKPILDDSIMREALVLAEELNFPVVQHAEDTRMTEIVHARGGAFVPLGIARHDGGCGASVVERDVQLAMHIPTPACT